MMPPQTLVKKCPDCAKYILDSTRSGNTFRSVLWSDGKLVGPMLPEVERLVLCPQCRAGVWILELPELKEYIDYDDVEIDANGQTYTVTFVESLTFADYMRYIVTANIDTGKQIYVRRAAWWCANDNRRKNNPMPLTPPEIANLRALLPLLVSSHPEQVIMKAEILRQLAEFAAAQLCLESVTDPKQQYIVDFLLARIAARDATLQRINA
jgi:hypothetical protein